MNCFFTTLRNSLLLGLGALILFSPAMGQAAPVVDKNTLVYSWGVHAGEGNPHLYSPNQMYAQTMVYDALVQYGQDGVIQPALAESWVISPDGRTYTFTLRKNVLFTDGTPFDAKAAKQNFDTILANKARHQWIEAINQLKTISSPASHTLIIELHNPYYPLLQELSLPRPFRFLSPSAFPDSGNTSDGIKKPVGTGPWILAETRKGEYDLFVRNDNYWGPKPSLQKVLIKIIPDPQTRVLALETGEIDLIFGGSGHGSGQISLESFNQLRQDKNYVTALSPAYSTRTMLLSASSGPTQDLQVRKAIIHAVQKDSIIRTIFQGVEHKADTLFAPNMPYSNLSLQPLPYDPAAAQALLEAAGWPLKKGDTFRTKGDESLRIILSFVGNNALHKSIAEVVQGNLRAVGIEAVLVGEEPDAYNKRHMEGDFQMTFGDTWGAPYDPHSFCGSMRAPSHGDYQAQVGLPMKAALDTQIGQALTSTDEQQRAQLYRSILSTLHDQAIYLPLSYEPAVTVHRKNITGVVFGPTAYDMPFGTIRKQ